jgi:hypothetical protein
MYSKLSIIHDEILQTLDFCHYAIVVAYLAENGFIAVCISSSVRLLVSGISFATNRTVKPDMLENIKKVPDKK